VTVESTVGQGTRVTLILPRAVGALAREKAPETQLASTGAQSILLVDDDPEVASATTTLLEQLGYKVRTVQSAEDALLFARRHHRPLRSSPERHCHAGS